MQVGTVLYFSPYDQNSVGIFDTASNIFSSVATPYTATCTQENGGSGCWYYIGAAAVGTKVRTLAQMPKQLHCQLHHDVHMLMYGKVYFAPAYASGLGILDVTSNAFSTVSNGLPTLNPGGSGRHSIHALYYGAVSIGTRVVFVPWYTWMNGIGIVDTTTDTFSTVAIGDANAGTGVTTNRPFSDATVVGTKVYFTPDYYTSVGILDVTSNAFSTVAATSGTGWISGRP